MVGPQPDLGPHNMLLTGPRESPEVVATTVMVRAEVVQDAPGLQRWNRIAFSLSLGHDPAFQRMDL